ncbi:MAG: arginase family protein [Deltaproteobacteria bacterium]|nr:arginase family protein [Deltaproteobacteria bacterium]
MPMLSALDRLRVFLRPPGKGLFTLSTGGGYASGLLRTLYGSDAAPQVEKAWEDQLARVRRARIIVIGVPSDTGAGIMRGANFGPIGIREALLRSGPYPKEVLDLGDVLCIPQLLHDEMLSDEQIKTCRAVLYPGLADALPVSPLSICENVLYTIAELNPGARMILLGGDHSVGWPAVLGCLKRFGNDFGVLHFDAHPDLMEHRLGIKYCFGTWAFHAVQRMRPQSLVQVGIRTTLKTKEFWESKFPVRQFWAQEALAQPTATADAIIKHFQSRGLKRIYISNDIDGTDILEAPATGTPEASGLHAEFVEGLIRRVHETFEVIGGDVVEVAPPLSGSREFAQEKTCQLAARYVKALF